MAKQNKFYLTSPASTRNSKINFSIKQLKEKNGSGPPTWLKFGQSIISYQGNYTGTTNGWFRISKHIMLSTDFKENNN